MKFILSFVSIMIIAIALIFCGQANEEKNEDYMRIHVVANSNSEQDKSIKYLVKDAVVDFLIPLLAEATTKVEAEEIIAENLNKIKGVADDVLNNQGVNYFATVTIQEEKIPTRLYGDMVFEEGIYESLNIKLGNAKGDNWWCVVFPAVCFVDTKSFQNIEYISKIWDIINDVTK